MASGYIRTVSSEKIESLKLSRAIGDCVSSFSRAAEADRRDTEDLLADHVQAIGRDKRDWIIYVVIVLAFREDQRRREVVAYAVAPGAQGDFERYIANKLTNNFEEVKLA